MLREIKNFILVPLLLVGPYFELLEPLLGQVEANSVVRGRARLNVPNLIGRSKRLY